MSQKKIEKKLQKLQIRLNELFSLVEKYDYSIDEMNKVPFLVYSLERLIQITIESVVDISQMIIAANEWEFPETYREAVRPLVEHKVISKEVGKKLEAAIGFRNILVHDYDQIDYEEVEKDLRDLDIFKKFVNDIKDFLEKESDLD